MTELVSSNKNIYFVIPRGNSAVLFKTEIAWQTECSVSRLGRCPFIMQVFEIAAYIRACLDMPRIDCK